MQGRAVKCSAACNVEDKGGEGGGRAVIRTCRRTVRLDACRSVMHSAQQPFCFDTAFLLTLCGNYSGEKATIDDWEQHLSTVFPDVRMKKFLEMRGADGGPWKMICAMPALWVGLLYDKQAQKEALEMIKEWTVEEMTELRNEV